MNSSITRRLVATLSTVGLAASVVGTVLASPRASADTPAAAVALPADSDELYAACGRVFPDPHAHWPSPTAAAGESPFAKGNAACRSTDFVSYAGMVSGMEYLESLYPDFVDFQKLEEDYGSGQDCATTTDANAMCSAGLPTIGVSGPERTRSDLYMVRLTDERVPDTEKKRFSFPLSIHGIERAGAEAGVRIAEDLAVWGYCEAVQAGTLAPNGVTNCTQEGAIPHALMETLESSVTAGAALAQSEIYLVFANPDGWRRGDQDNGVRSFQRYNGNGVDMNRDWPTEGYTFRPYTPWSEPETKSFGEAMKSIADTWDGGIDLHGQNEANAFSFTMMGASQRDYGKNQRILQTVKGAYEDAENRLAWSPLIKPNDTDPDDPRMYGVQWGTVWDTIDYTVTGSLGDWIDSPIGLNADGIDNEMSFSHLYNCGTGTCYVANNEQLHVDGNKSLVFAMVNFTLLPEDTDFDVPGNKVGYVLDDTILADAGASPPPSYVGFAQQDAIQDVSLDITNNWTYAFEILGPDDGVYNGGVTGTATTTNLGGVSGGSLNSLILERYRGGEGDPPALSSGCDSDDDWETVNEYFNQSIIYAQGGQAVHANAPLPGIWRICLTGDETNFASSTTADLDISFTAEAAWADPGQVAYDDVTNMNFFAELAPYMTGAELEAIDPDALLAGTTDLSEYRSIVIADDPFPGFTEPVPTGAAQPDFATEVGAGVGTAPCAYQRGDTDVPPGSNTPQPGCYVSYEFDILASYNNQKFTATLDTANEDINDWDLFVDRLDPESGIWFEAGSSATGTGDERVALPQPLPGRYRALVVNWSAAEPPLTQTLTRTFSNVYEGPPPGVSERTTAERDAWGASLRAYVENGGNLVLTDGALKNLAYMDLVPRAAVTSTSVYAGFIGFTTDGSNDTYGDPLAAGVNQPGAAEGPNHRHQTYEPVPIGYAIQDDEGNNANHSPVWTVDKSTWEAAGGRTVGVTGGGRTSLGELAAGDGVVRIIGPLVPMPSQQHYHPYGLADYSLTYTGYQVLHNALQWEHGNVAPIAIDDVAAVDPGGSVNIAVKANDSDPDNSIDSLTVTIESGPSDGTADVEVDGTITYTHAGTEPGADSFVYRLTDPSGASDTATVSVTIGDGGGGGDAVEGRVHGSGWWDRGSGDKHDKVDFSFDARVAEGGALQGKLFVHDKDLDLKVRAKTITSLSTGAGVDCDGVILDGENSFAVAAEGPWELDGVEGEGTYFACGIDNGKNNAAPVDYLAVRCVTGCVYDSTERTPDSDIDGGNIHLQIPIVDADDRSGAGSDPGAAGAAPGEGSSVSDPSGERSSGEALVVDLDPILLSEALAGTPVVLTAVVEGSDALLGGAAVQLAWVAADGSTGTAEALTNTVGVATFAVTMPPGGVEYQAIVGDLGSNGVRISALPAL